MNMSVLKYSALVLTLACCNFAFGQQQVDQNLRERVENRRDQISQNREQRQDNRDVRQAERARDGRELGASATANQSTGMDEFIATCLLIGNQEEVALAKQGVEQAQNERVKQFAQTLVNDHQQAIQKLEQHAKQGMGLEGAANITGSSSLESSHGTSATSPTAQQYTANRPNLDDTAMRSGGLNQVLKLQQQAAQECLSMTKSMLQEKQGAEFDKAFAGTQVGVHVGMLAKLKASQQFASPELAGIIRESEQVVQNHLEQAKQLCQQLETASSQEASTR